MIAVFTDIEAENGGNNMDAILSGELRKFVAPEFVFGLSARTQAGRYASHMGISRVLLVTDKGVVEAGWASSVMESLQDQGVEFVIFDEVTPNPKSEGVMKGAARYLETDCHGIVAVGGGSPIDCAKGIGIVVTNKGHILEYEGVDQVAIPMPPLICVPTTAGTAADISQFAILVDEKNRNKIAIISKAIVPDVSLIDPETTVTMDACLTTNTGMDSLVHAIEAYVSNASSPFTDIHAIAAIQLLSKSLAKTVAEPSNMEYRMHIMLGCLEAGLAFSNASLGAVHAMSHSLGGYFDLPHGKCNSLLLDRVVEFNFDSQIGRFRDIAEAMRIDIRGMNNREIKNTVVKWIIEFRKGLGITESLGSLGVKAADIPELAVKALHDPCLVTNPRSTGKRDIEVLYEEAL